ncbi:hypothetical protein Dxin01_00821 [Deinococcus xinjiangensis]|uniref:Uncharacterized protein n=1 Tax=Deinococcus xinjiangensis TaxID=457454 RepID=A0ABP9V726_9DEIO
MRYFLMTPKRPDAERWPKDVVKDTSNALAAATGAPLPYPEVCLQTEIGREWCGFLFNWSAYIDGLALNTRDRWVNFLYERVAVGAFICTEERARVSLDEFLCKIGVAALAGHSDEA